MDGWTDEVQWGLWKHEEKADGSEGSILFTFLTASCSCRELIVHWSHKNEAAQRQLWSRCQGPRTPLTTGPHRRASDQRAGGQAG